MPAAAVLAGLVVALGLGAAAAVAAPSQVIRSDEWLGSYGVKQDGKLGGALRAFGTPTLLSRRVRSGTCLARWSRLGLEISFSNLGGQDPCGRATGFFGSATITGPGWRTTKGLATGDSTARLRALFPGSRRHGDRWWLVPRLTRATGSYAGLSARTTRGKVVDFQVIYGAGGE